ncbi:MAG: hypothetical protein ACHQ50_11140 [Fimbriimonadales bacterium]
MRRMLREIADLAENASLTGGMSSGTSRAVQRYNAVLRQLVESGAVPKGVFEELNVETTDYGQLAVDARLLASYLKGQESDCGSSRGEASVLIRLAPFIRGEDLAALVRDHIAQGAHINSHVITALAPFLGSDQLGQLVREHMIADAAAPANGVTPPTPPTPPAHSGETLQELAEQLRRSELSKEDRERIAARIAELAAGG